MRPDVPTSAGAALQALLAFVARERAQLTRDYAQTAALPVRDRVAAGLALGPLSYAGTTPDGRLRFRLDTDDSRFREGDSCFLGPAAVGEEAIAHGRRVSYVGFDVRAQELQVEPDEDLAGSAIAPPAGELFLDARKMDLSDLYVKTVETALGGTAVSPLVRAVVFGGPRNHDRRRAATLAAIGAGLGLDPSQANAFSQQATSPLALVQGPPGTGKTRVLGAVVRTLLGQGKRVLVCALAHRAVNNALASCIADLDDGVPVVKLGQPSQAEGLPAQIVRVRRGREVVSRLRSRSGPLLVGTSVARVPGLVQDSMPPFDVVVFDEAGQLTLPQMLCGVIAASQAYVVGDHRQLTPIFQAEHPEDEWRLDRSAFEMLAEQYPPALLRRSYRLNAQLVAFPSAAFYDGQLVAAPESAGQFLVGAFPTDHPLFPLLDPAAPLVWGAVEHRFQRTPSPAEADVVAACVQLALEAGLGPEQLAVLSPYRAQNQAIRNRLRASAARGVDGADLVVVDTVERMQGQERDLVIVSLAVSDPLIIEQHAEFLYLPNRLNVAVTRARTKCIVLGSPVLVSMRSTRLEVLRGTTALRRLRACAREVDIRVLDGPAFDARLVRHSPSDIVKQWSAW